MNPIRIINVSFQIWGSVMSIILILCLLGLEKYRTKGEKLYLSMITLNMAGMIFDAIALYFRGRLGGFSDFGVRASNFLEFISGSILAAIFLLYVQNYIEEKISKKISAIFQHMALGLMTLSILLLIINLFHPFIYQINEANLYSRMVGYPIIMLPAFSALILTLILIIRYRESLNRWEKIPFLIYIFAPIAGIIGTTLVYGIVFAHIGTTGAMLVMFILLQVEQNQRILQREREMAQLKLDIMFSQIQPHFLHNTLASLSVLCEENPKEASKAIDEFSKYLRRNMDSLRWKNPIPFTKELEHIKSYITLEKIRFEDGLEVTYDILEKDFYVPALSVQPIIENSILHGMMGKEDPCHITVHTRKNGNNIEIIVEDDGCGFDPQEKKQDGRSHIGIENVRERLGHMVNGKLLIESIPGVGTKATIQIPIEEE